MTFKCFVVILILTISRLAAAEAPTVPIIINDAGSIIVPVKVNGSGPFRFLLDTGASHSVIADTLASKLALPTIGTTTVATSIGEEVRDVVQLNLTTIGPARSEGLRPSIASVARLAAIVRGIHGIIGQDFLFGFNYTLDYRKHRLVWFDEVRDDAALALVVRGGRYLVPIDDGTSEPMLLVPDSAATGVVMFERDGRTRLPLDRTLHMTNVTTLSGARAARSMMLRELRLGAATLKDQLVAVLKRDVRNPLEGDGLLPLHLFASVTFDAREQRIVFRP